MKKKVFIIALIFVILFGSINCSFAVHIEAKGSLIQQGYVVYYAQLFSNGTEMCTKDGYGTLTPFTVGNVKQIMEQKFGYTGEIKTKIIVPTTITVKEVIEPAIYKVDIGNIPATKYFLGDTSEAVSDYESLTLKQLKTRLGYIGENDPVKGSKWEVKAKISVSQIRYVVETTGNTGVPFMIQCTDIYSGEEPPDDALDGATDITLDPNKLGQSIIDPVVDVVGNKIAEFFGSLFINVMDFFRAIPDALQRGVNSIGKIDTIEAQTTNAEPEPISASYKTIQADSSKNERANVTLNEENKGDPNKQEIVTLDEKENKFSENTEIPIIPLDMYNIVYGKVNFLDVNFFKVDTTKHQEGSKWMYIRRIFASALNTMIFLCLGFLTAILIIHGILIVKGTMIPEKKKEHIDGLRHFLIAVFMLVGSVLIMNICIYGTNALIGYLGNAEEGDAFYRVNIVGETNYSFSANMTEFVRFMTQINTVDKIGDKVMYVLLYIVLVAANLLTLGVMLVRSGLIVILSVQGPIIATAYSIDKKVFNMSYSDWTKKYLKWTMVQVFLMVAYMIIIKVSKL